MLVIDVGNTRLKWSWLANGRLSEQQAVPHLDIQAEIWSTEVFDAQLRPQRVLISNVAGEAMAKTLQRMSRKAFHVEPEFITPTRNFHELTNGYLNPSLLGPDRWLAVIGAWNLAHEALCVIDAGTAVKVDSVNADGRHLGGLIVPGVHMMRDSLMKKTSGIAAAMTASALSTAGILANNTVAAVSRGSVMAAASLADRAAQFVHQETGVQPRIFVTGGDAELIAGSMCCEGALVPDLVLQGIAVLATQDGLG